MVAGLGALAWAAAATGATASMAREGARMVVASSGSASGHRRYTLLILSANQATHSNWAPGDALVYFSGTDVNTQWSTGVPYSEAAANGWLLKDAAGNLLVNRGYPNNDVGDVGNPAYQQAWITNVLAYLAANPGVKGVFIDDVLYDLTPLAGREAAEYPTQQAWAQAQLSFIQTVGMALRAKGYYVLANASGYVPGAAASDDGNNTIHWWRKLGPYVNGLMNEYYQETSDGNDTVRSAGNTWFQYWDNWERLVNVAQRLGDDFVGVTYGPSDGSEQLTYGDASFLLDWNGRGGAFIYHTPSVLDNQGAPLSIAWTTSIGKPAAPKQQVGTGWMRRYTDGVALVHPNPAAAQSFALGGRYLTPNGAAVTSVTLAPTTAMILPAAPSDRVALGRRQR